MKQTNIINKLSIIDKLLELSEEERLEIFNQFCKHCGSKYLPCNCWRDE